MSDETANIGKRKERIGEVISDKMSKTIVVRVVRKYRHPKFNKVVSSQKKYYAHDEKEQASIGDLVCIQESRPISKSKHWRLFQILNADGSIKASV